MSWEPTQRHSDNSQSALEQKANTADHQDHSEHWSETARFDEGSNQRAYAHKPLNAQAKDRDCENPTTLAKKGSDRWLESSDFIHHQAPAFETKKLPIVIYLPGACSNPLAQCIRAVSVGAGTPEFSTT